MLLPVVYLRWQKANAKTKAKYQSNWRRLEAQASLRLG